MDDLYETWEALIDAMHCVSNKTEENCNIRGNLGGLKYADAFETWMIGDKCMFTSSLWAQKQPPIAPVTHTEAFPMMHQQPPNGTSCCDECSFTVNGRVDIFYWPDPDADYSCLDIIGTEVKAIDDGATVDIWTYNLLNTVYSNTYWGCTARHPISGSSIIQTASLVTMGGYVFKQYLKDPWNPPDCIDMPQTMKAPGSASLIPENSVWHTVNTSGQQSSITRLQSHLGSTAVLDGITFTSPSVYARFRDISAWDWCGTTKLSETLMSFAPGELSTIAGTLGSIEVPWSTTNAKPFRLADLPCPPRSVMEEKWYSPRPGEPYQPWLAAPKQFSTFGGRPRCNAWCFSAIDPPKALTVGSLLAAEVPFQPQSGCPEPCATSTVSTKVLTSADMMLPTNPPPPAPGPVVQNQPTATDFHHDSVTPSTGGDQQVADQKHESAENGSNDEHDLQRPTDRPVEDRIPGQRQNAADSDSDFGEVNPASQPPIQDAKSGGEKDDGSKDTGSGSRPEDASSSIKLLDGSQAIKDPSSQNFVVGDHIVPLASIADANHAHALNQAPIATTLPDGSRAMLFPPEVQDPAQPPPSIDANGEANKPGSSPVAPSHSAMISAYGTTLTAGGPAVTIDPSQSGIDPHSPVTSPFILSLDPKLNLIYNPTTTSFIPVQTHRRPDSDDEKPITILLTPGIPLVIFPHNQGISIDGKTLRPGPHIATATSPGSSQSSAYMVLADGTTVSLLDDSEVVINSTRTITLPSTTDATSIASAISGQGSSQNNGSVGAAIKQQFGGPAGSAAGGGNGSKIQDFTGGATSRTTVDGTTQRWLSSVVCGAAVLELLRSHIW